MKLTFVHKNFRIQQKTFFKFFKVDLESECPFWAMQVMCGAAGGCSVCKCDDKDIPIPWKITKNSPVNTFLGTGKERPQPWVDKDRDMWIPKSSYSSDGNGMTYVNLLLNPETNTGFSGKDANRVWQAIYTENCFKGGKLEEMCYEERVFYRLLSGLHSSITMKIATYHFKRDPDNKHIEHNTYDSFTPNYEMFDRAVAKFPDRLKNLYFLYSFMLRCVALCCHSAFCFSLSFSHFAHLFPLPRSHSITERFKRQHQSCRNTTTTRATRRKIAARSSF